MDWHPWLLYAHLLGTFAFAAGHGVSATMAFRLRGERDPIRIGAILDFSLYSLSPTSLMTVGFVTLLLSGIAGGFEGAYWGQAWIWISIVLLIVVTGVMTPFGALHYNKVRTAIGQKLPRDKSDSPPPPPLPADQLEALLISPRPWQLAGAGGIGFALIVYLMVFKPF